MTGGRFLWGAGLLLLAACAQVQEEAVLAEPIIMEKAASVEAIKRAPCPAESDDGIGGTGCSPD